LELFNGEADKLDVAAALTAMRGVMLRSFGIGD
jgi:hypothetical protein